MTDAQIVERLAGFMGWTWTKFGQAVAERIKFTLPFCYSDFYKALTLPPRDLAEAVAKVVGGWRGMKWDEQYGKPALCLVAINVVALAMMARMLWTHYSHGYFAAAMVVWAIAGMIGWRLGRASR